MATNGRPVGEFTALIGGEIKIQRKELHILQKDLSAAAQVPVTTLSQMESGKVTIDMEQLHRIATALDMTPEALVGSARRRAEIAKRVEAELQARAEESLIRESGEAEAAEQIETVASRNRRSHS